MRQMQIMTPGEQKRGLGLDFLSQVSAFPLRGWRVAKMDGDGEPGQRRPGAAGLRNPVNPEMCRGHRTLLPALPPRPQESRTTLKW